MLAKWLRSLSSNHLLAHFHWQENVLIGDKEFGFE